METLAQENAVLPQAQLTPIEQPKQNNFLVILLSALLLLSVSIAGFFAYQTQVLVKELTSLKNSPTSNFEANIEPTTMPATINSPISTLNPKLSWKTYLSEKGQFELKYPDDKTEISHNASNYDWINIREKGPYLSGNINIDLKVVDSSKSPLLEEYRGGEGMDKSAIIVAGQTVIAYHTDTSGDGGSYPLDVFELKNGNLIYFFSISNIKSPEILQILSTFKFTDSVDGVVEIKSIFEKVNKELNTKITAIEQSKFYDPNLGSVDQSSWSMDLTSVLTDKSQINIVQKVLLSQGLTLDPSKSAGGSEAAVDAFSGNGMLCYLIIEPMTKKLNCAIN